MTVMNTIAYYGAELITTIQCFIVQARLANVIKLFSSLLTVGQNKLVCSSYNSIKDLPNVRLGILKGEVSLYR